MSTLILLLIAGFVLVAASSLIALGHAIVTADDGFEDASGFHGTASSPATNPATPTVDTGNPWDQVEGACCPLDLGYTTGHNPVHQP